MQTKMMLAALVAMVLSVGLVACGGNDASNLKQIQQQRSGEYVVALLSETGQLKQGPNTFALEFRKASDNSLADVGAVQLQSIMPMPGMSPMSGGASATPSGTPGRYNVTSDFEMRGKWNFTVIYGGGQRVLIPINVQ